MPQYYCKHEGCLTAVLYPGNYCSVHLAKATLEMAKSEPKQSMSQKYPKYYKKVPEGVTEIDTYAVNQMFPVEDSTGCIIHARKKLLVPGTRTGGKSLYLDIKEARDALDRWLELNKDKQ